MNGSVGAVLSKSKPRCRTLGQMRLMSPNESYTGSELGTCSETSCPSSGGMYGEVTSAWDAKGKKSKHAIREACVSALTTDE